MQKLLVSLLQRPKKKVSTLNLCDNRSFQLHYTSKNLLRRKLFAGHRISVCRPHQKCGGSDTPEVDAAIKVVNTPL